PKPIVITGWAVSTLGAAALLPLADWHLSVVGVALMVVGNLCAPATSAYVAATTARGSLGGTMGVVWASAFFGNVIGAPFSGVLAASIGLRGGLAVALAVFIVSTLCTLLLRPLPPHRERVPYRPSRRFLAFLLVVPAAAALTVLPRQLM